MGEGTQYFEISCNRYQISVLGFPLWHQFDRDLMKIIFIRVAVAGEEAFPDLAVVGVV